MDNSRALVPVQTGNKALSFPELKEFAEVAAASTYFLSKDVTNKNKALALMMIGRELGLGPAASLRGIYLINGVPNLTARTMSSLIKMSGEFDYKTIRREDTVAEVAILRRVEGKWVQQEPTCVFTVADAKRAGLFDKKSTPWNQYPRNMCWARALSDAFGIHCPHLACGMPVYAVAQRKRCRTP